MGSSMGLVAAGFHWEGWDGVWVMLEFSSFWFLPVPVLHPGVTTRPRPRTEEEKMLGAGKTGCGCTWGWPRSPHGAPGFWDRRGGSRGSGSVPAAWEEHGKDGHLPWKGRHTRESTGSVAIYKHSPYAALQKRVRKKSWDRERRGFLGDESPGKISSGRAWRGGRDVIVIPRVCFLSSLPFPHHIHVLVLWERGELWHEIPCPLWQNTEKARALHEVAAEPSPKNPLRSKGTPSHQHPFHGERVGVPRPPSGLPPAPPGPHPQSFPSFPELPELPNAPAAMSCRCHSRLWFPVALGWEMGMSRGRCVDGGVWMGAARAGAG
ncbi:PREDICTED: uncharacterized protein LOC108447128 [Corvus brachyrhynchos]|uniref:uncharacterized protein LOC108447128 n=1 Tax=Corvus brachyrhynchos TaxID=85066 RepID=UPI000816505B|nr:PREDICTED: uncharacterized protein LOC108447128 [Corvus brachyrhynchos]